MQYPTQLKNLKYPILKNMKATPELQKNIRWNKIYEKYDLKQNLLKQKNFELKILNQIEGKILAHGLIICKADKGTTVTILNLYKLL